MTPRNKDRCVNSIYVKFAIISISSCGILFDLFYLDLYLGVKTNGMVGAGICYVNTLIAGTFIL